MMTKRPDMLDSLQISVPCSIDWDQMVGSDRIRYCSECRRDVYNISRMTRNEAQALISSANGRLCVRLVREANGSTLTAEPYTGVHLGGRRVSPIATAVVTAIMGIGGNAVAAPPAQANLPVSAYSDSVMKRTGEKAEPADSTGTVEGTVLDPNQAAIVGAAVILKNEVTGDVRGTTSSDAGAFSFKLLKPGSYTLEIQAEGFSRQLINGLGVAMNQAKQVPVKMSLEPQVVTVGGSIAAPQPLRTLYNSNELIVVARVGDSRKIERDGSSVLMKTALTISSTLKGHARKPIVYVYHWTYGEDAKQPFVTGDDLLVFLTRHEDRQTGKVQDGYEVYYPRYGVKKLSAADLAVYVSRIKELREMKQTDVNSPEIAEWLVRCAEEPATRWEGATELAWSAGALRQRESGDEDTDAKESDENGGEVSSVGTTGSVADEKKVEDIKGSADEEESRTPLISLLTTKQKERLAAALFGTGLVSEKELELIEIEKEMKDPRLLPFLISQLRALEADSPEFVETIVDDVAELMDDEDVNKFLEEYRESGTRGDESAEAADVDDDATQDQSDAEASDVAAAAATASRRIMLQNFLLLVEGKLKHSANPKSDASASSPDSTN
ncbi:MAG TPA: carboxypeptidase-like regulatory domain-containing protein [Blastocatellia bacterium]|jgi:hypothetical protein|nr:carboxypeptidase-like regulatory domain-containing protein [Blastocatellia bacterium]